MIVNKYNNGGGSGSGSTDLTNYWNSAVTEQHIESAASITYASAASYADLAVAGIDLSAYLTSADTQDYVNSGDVKSQVEAYNYITSAYVADTLTAYTPTTGFSTINGSAITSGGNIEIQGGGGGDMTELQPVSELPESAETGVVMALASAGLPAGFTFELGTGLGYGNDRTGGTLTVANNAALGVTSADPIYLFTITADGGHTCPVYAWECEWDSRGISLCFGEPDSYVNLIDMAPGAEDGDYLDLLGEGGGGNVDATYDSNSSTPGFIQIYNADDSAEPTFDVPAGNIGLYQYDGSAWKSYSTDGFITSADTQNFVTSAQTQSAITAVEDHINDVEEVTASALTELHNTFSSYTPTTGFSTINGSAITSGGNITIQGGGGGGISQADLASSGYLYCDSNDYTDNNLDYAVDYLKSEPGYNGPAMVDYDSNMGYQGQPNYPKHIVTIYQSDYDDLLNYHQTDQNTFYIVLPDPN